MKSFRAVLGIIIISLNLQAQQIDSLKIAGSDVSPLPLKSGFGWGGSPVLAFDADLGFRFGAVINLFDYGKVSRFPDYVQFANIKAFRSTKGTTHIQGFFESDKIIPGIKVTAEAAYIKDILLDFYGFNGIKARLDQSLANPESDEYVNKFFYNHQRALTRFRIDFQLPLKSGKSRVFAGLTYNNYHIRDIDYEQLQIPQGPDGHNAVNTTLFKKFVEWQVIESAEAAGGQLTTLSLGYIYDTRSSKLNCKDGLWLETFFVHSPAILSSSSFTKHIATARYYYNFGSYGAVFSIRLSSQQKLQGTIPFYAASTFYETRQNQDGVGGAFTLRGVNRNRIVSDGFMLANTELRKTALSFQVRNILCQIDLSAFADASYVTQEYNFAAERIPEPYRSNLTSNQAQKVSVTFGPGLYFIYNTNNIISVNLGISGDKQLGKTGLYIGSGFLF